MELYVAVAHIVGCGLAKGIRAFLHLGEVVYGSLPVFGEIMDLTGIEVVAAGKGHLAPQVFLIV